MRWAIFWIFVCGVHCAGAQTVSVRYVDSSSAWVRLTGATAEMPLVHWAANPQLNNPKLLALARSANGWEARLDGLKPGQTLHFRVLLNGKRIGEDLAYRHLHPSLTAPPKPIAALSPPTVTATAATKLQPITPRLTGIEVPATAVSRDTLTPVAAIQPEKGSLPKATPTDTPKAAPTEEPAVPESTLVYAPVVNAAQYGIILQLSSGGYFLKIYLNKSGRIKSGCDLVLRDETGNTLHREKEQLTTNGLQALDLRRYPSGIYFLQLEDPRGAPIVARIAKP